MAGPSGWVIWRFLICVSVSAVPLVKMTLWPGGESPAAQVVGRAVGAVGDKLVPVTRRLGSAALVPAGQVDLGAP
jgi:hypothetical protein